MRFSLRHATQIAVLCAIVGLGCSGDSEKPTVSCDTSVDDLITSPAPGVATLHGEFFSNETVIVQETDGTVIASGTPDSNRNAFSFTGIPSGTHRYEIVISCDAGREEIGGFTFDIQ